MKPIIAALLLTSCVLAGCPKPPDPGKSPGVPPPAPKVAPAQAA